ncbi:MAG: T9SS type A sorting domain-containing protein [bacterium]
MKLLFSVLFVLLLSLNDIFSLTALTGTYTIGIGGDYITFSSAISSLNSNGVGLGGVTFLIKNGTYEETSSLQIYTSTSNSINKVIFKPEPGANVILNIGGQTSTNRYAVKITSNYIIFDGSNETDGTDRDFTIKSSNASYGSICFDIYGDYNEIKNCNLDIHSNFYNSGGYGIFLRGGAATNTTAENNIISNNLIKGNTGIIVGGITTIYYSNNNEIINNEIYFHDKGIYVNSTNSIDIINNNLCGDLGDNYTTNMVYGICLTNLLSSNIVIEKNRIHDIGNKTTTNTYFLVYGVAVIGTGNFTIAKNKIYNLNNINNFEASDIFGLDISFSSDESIYNISNNAFCHFRNIASPKTPIRKLSAINITNVGTYNIYFNSVYFEGDFNTIKLSAICLTNDAQNAAVTIKNNIWQCSNIDNESNTYLYYFDHMVSGIKIMDYNNYLIDNNINSCIGRYNDINYSTIVNWKNFVGNETHSQQIDPLFHSSTDLHLLPNSPCSEKGTAITGYTTDIDGESRNSPPDIGADEFTYMAPASNGSYNNPPAGSQTTIIPISNVGGVSINPSIISSGNVQAYFINQQPSGLLPNDITKISNYHWVLSTNINNFQTNVRFYYDQIIDNGINNPDNISLLKRENQSDNWVIYTNVNKTETYIEALDLTMFSEFSFGENNATPVELSSFYATVDNNNVILGWQTATELSSIKFQIERKKSDENNWKTVGEILSHGTSYVVNNYSFKDNNIITGQYFYRLKNINTNGSYEYSKEIFVSVGVPKKYYLSQNYPNPFNPNTIINFNIPKAGLVNICVYTITGELVSTVINEEKEAGYYSILVSGSNLASGVYFYRIRVNEYSNTKKLVILH